MPKLHFRNTSRALCLLVSFAIPGLAQDTASDSTRRADLIRRAMEQLRAGPEHQVLRQFVGDWEQTARYAAGARKPDVVMTGNATVREILDGRFIVVEGSAESPDLRTDALTILGYDRRFKRFTYVGFDNLGTYYVTAAGPMEPDSATVRMAGEDRLPTGSVKKYEMVLRVRSPDEFVVEIIFFTGDGARHVAATTTHRRRGTTPVGGPRP